MAISERRPGESNTSYMQRIQREQKNKPTRVNVAPKPLGNIPDKLPGETDQAYMQRITQSVTDRVKKVGDSLTPMNAGPSMPQLSPWLSIESLGEKGKLTPSLITSKAIQEEMDASPWYKMALERQGMEESKQRGASEQQMATQAAQARGLLASRGGLRGGAAERLASQSADNLALMRQGILGQGAEARADLGLKGLGLASDIVGRNVSAENVARQQNVANVWADLQNQNARNLEKYREEMKMKGAEETSEGIRKSGGGKGFFQDPGGSTQAFFRNLTR